MGLRSATINMTTVDSRAHGFRRDGAELHSSQCPIRECPTVHCVQLESLL